MPHRLAHLSALPVFVAVVRHGSFREAAAALDLTPSAVSHQIRGFEHHLGVRLFERHARSISLTEAGTRLFPRVERALDEIGGAVMEVRSLDRPAVIRLSCGPAIAAKWLAPRAYRFREKFPSITLDISISNSLVDLDRGDMDVAIRHGRGGYQGVDTMLLFGEAYAPICAPTLSTAEERPLRATTDLAAHRLLHDDAAAYPGKTAGWAEWLEAHGGDPALARGGQHFSQTDHAIQAAIDGAGVLLGRLSLAAGDLEAGRLVQPLDGVLPSPFAYWLVTAAGRLCENPIRALASWLREEAARSRLPISSAPDSAGS